MRQLRRVRCIARLKRFTSDGCTNVCGLATVGWFGRSGRRTKRQACISDSWNCGIFCGRGKSFFNNCSPPRTASSEPRRKEAKKHLLRETHVVDMLECLIARVCSSNLDYPRKHCDPSAIDSLNEKFWSKGYDNSFISFIDSSSWRAG